MRQLQIFLNTILNSSLQLSLIKSLIVLDKFHITQKDMLLCAVNKEKEKKEGKEGERERKGGKKEVRKREREGGLGRKDKDGKIKKRYGRQEGRKEGRNEERKERRRTG